jgi:phage host-nuclease inhibitor protein Gam
MAQQTTLRNWQDADRALLELGRHEALIQQAEAEMNERIQRLRDEYDQKTATSRKAKLALEKDLELFCIANKTEFQKARTKELSHGTLGFRTTPPRVALLNRKYNWETVVQLLKKMVWGRDYIRTLEEVDKERILSDVAAEEIDDKSLAAVGLKVDQSEKFIYDIKWDTITD